MYTRYELWVTLYRKFVNHLKEYCSCSSHSLAPSLDNRCVARPIHSGTDGWNICRNALLLEYRKHRQRLAKREQLELAREMCAAREIAQHCRSNNRTYSELRELEALDSGRPLSFLQRIFLENRYIFEAIAKHIRTTELLTDVRVNPSLEQLHVGKSNLQPETLRRLTEYLLESEYCGYVHIYTDASKSPDGQCGIGVYDETNEVRIAVQLKLDTSIMTAETLAIKVAMQHIANRGIHQAVLLTDSQAACTFLKKNRNSRYRNAVANEILELARTFEVTIQWIPGHVEVSGNRIADELSRAALANDTQRLENDIFIHDAISYFEERQASKINKWYQEYIRLKGKSLKQLCREDDDSAQSYCAL
uniref:RNase H type-1 domain-containing protein n=1 Tax=Anopheles culicifacies TaxID=139723 RepID=A0A182LW02_9DIPT